MYTNASQNLVSEGWDLNDRDYGSDVDDVDDVDGDLSVRGVKRFICGYLISCGRHGRRATECGLANIEVYCYQVRAFQLPK